MLQPKYAKQLDSNIKELVANGGSNEDIDKMASDYTAMFSEDALKKKGKSNDTATPPKLGSGTSTGSSGGVNPAFKSAIPSTIPDFNSMESVKPVVQKPKVKLQKPPVEEETSFFDYLKENLDTGLATVSKSVYDAPGFIYDAAASITNPIIKGITGYKGEGASSDKLANDLGFRNIPSEILQEKIKVSNEKINAYSAKNGGDALQAVENGNYVGAAKLVAGTTAQSLPIMVAAMLSGGETMALTAIGVSTASTKNAQLKDENPEMGLGTRVLNATNAGIIEATTGHLFTGASGAVMKKIIADKGVDVGSKIIGKSFRNTIEKSIEKNPLVVAVGEVIEESAVEFGNQVNDMSSGIRTEFDFHAIKNAGLSATGMGGLQTLGVYGAKGYVKAKTYAKVKATNKEVFKLRSEIDNGNLSPENKAILSFRADRLEAENKKLLGTEIEKAKALPTEQKTELNALNQEFEDLKSKFDDIDDADDIPENLKPAMKEEIKLQASKNQKRKTEILSQNDGLEVNDDFSKFEGVEPDFDLENGKISSLPLKEQDRLNDQALQELTGGDMSIEVTKEQVSQKANEIYTNEQTPTPEAQPQAEKSKTLTKSDKDLIEKSIKDENYSPYSYSGNEGSRKNISIEVGDINIDYNPQELKESNDIGNNDKLSYSEKQEKETALQKKVLNRFLDENPNTKEEVQKPSEAEKVNDATSDAVNEVVNDAVSPVEDVVAPSVEENNFSEKSIDDLEKRQAEIEGNKVHSKEFNEIDKELGKREWQSIMLSPLGDVNAVLDNLVEKEKYMPNGFGAYIEKRDIRESKVIVKKYEGEVSKDEAANDFKDAFLGNPSAWYADGLKLKESVRVFMEKGGTFKELLQSVQKEFEADGFTEQDAASVIKIKLSEITKVNETTSSNDITPNASIRPTTPNVGEVRATEQEIPAKESVPSSVDGGEVKGDVALKDIESTTDALQELKDTTELNVIYKKWYANSTISKSFEKFKDTYFWRSKYLNEDTRSISKYLSQENTDAINKNIDSYAILEEKGKYFIEYGVSKGFDTTEAHKKVGKRVEISKKEAIDLAKKSVENQVSYNGSADSISKAYHEAKLDGSNPELVDGIEKILGKPAEIPQRKSKGDVEVSDLDHAKSQIDKGVLFWDGNIANERVDLGISWADIRKGEADIKRGKENTVPAKRLIEAIAKAKKEGGYHYKQGTGGVNQRAKIFVSLDDVQRSTNEYKLSDAEQKEVDANEVKLAQDYENYFEGLDLEDNIDIYENYENQKGNDGLGEKPTTSGESKNDVSNQEKPKPTTKEKIAERIKLSDANIDATNDVVKAKIKAFMDMFPSADINPDDYHTNGLNMDAIIDMIAKAAKVIAKGGIVTSEHIKEAIAGYNTIFDDKIDPKAVEERINPKKSRGFKREEGKSSVLKRIREGGNSPEINAIIDKIGLNYEGRRQEQVYADGVNFVKEVGIAEAYNAIKNGELKDSDTINVVYATILQGFPKMAESEIAKVTDPQELSDLVKELDDLHEKIYTEFKAKTIDAGRGSAILNFIYNQDLKIRYSLSQQIENFKKVNGGVVPDDVREKMKDLDNQYQQANKRIEELEGLLREAQEQKDFDNIVEEEKRQPKLSKTKREKAEKIIKALDDFEKSILQNNYSDATMITPILIQGIRATKLAIKQGVNIAEAIEKGIEGIKKELEKLGKNFDNEERFRNDLNKSLEGIETDVNQSKVTVDKNGKVRISTEMIKDFVSKGGTDLSEFAKQVQESIKDEFPDVSVRDIRESVANYGKKANKSRQQIVEDIQKLKSEERLRLEYEDLQNRISKEKNETKKRTLSQTQKRLKEQIKQLQDDLGVTEQERTNRSINYTKKRIEILRDKIKNNDFAKKEIKPIVESQELKDAKIEKNRIQEEFDYLSYQQELANRTIGDKALELLGDLYDSQRVTLATGELSFVGAQGAFYMIDSTFSRKTLKNLIENFKGTTVKDWKSNPFGTALKIAKSAHSGESLIKMFNTMGTANNYMDFQRLLKESPDYDLYLKMGLRLLGEDVKSQVKDDNFIGNNILNLLRVPIHLTDRIEKKELLNFKLKLAEDEKKRTTIQGYYEKLKTGKVSDKNKKTATEMFTNANPLSTFERGNNTFMNMARKELADIYIAKLRDKGKNPIDHIADFKDLGSAINTITGSGNMGPKTTMFLPKLNAIMFSARYFAASWNLTPPVSLYYLAKLGNYDGMELKNPKTWKTWKPTVAQKAFVKPMIKTFIASYGISLAVVAMINAAIDDDDEMTEEEKAKKRAYIEYDPRSSNWMQVNSGNSHTDYFGPYRSNVVLLSKIGMRETKNSSGEIIKNGTGFGSRTNRDIIVDYLAGKANPGLGVLIRNAQGGEKKVINEETGIEETKLMYYEDDVSFGYQIKHNTYPIFVKTVKAVLDEDPVLGASFYNTNAFFGKNTNIYKTKNQSKDKFGESQAKIKEYNNLPKREQDKVDSNAKIPSLRGAITEQENMKYAIKTKTPYYVKGDSEPIDLSDITIDEIDETIADLKKSIEEMKKEAGDRYKAPKE
jgi:hypothetical protein